MAPNDKQDHKQGHKAALLMINLGSPDAPNTSATRRYLAEFLHDYRVIDMSRWIWCPLLHGIILRTRPARSARAYASIWDQPDGRGEGEAPLIRITRAQALGVQARLGSDIHVEIAMRYGNPSIPDALAKLKNMGIHHIGILPMYPQFAGATTASVYDGVAKAVKTMWDMPTLRFLRDYHDDQRYIQALARSVTTHLAALDWEPQTILTSYHGLPQRYVDAGDPYRSECARTTDLLREALSMNAKDMQLTFQSRFGPEDWLQPYTDKTLEALPREGIKRVAVMTPGFSADCLETLEEINMEARESFIEAGGEAFTYIPCLNTHEDHLDLLAGLAREQLLTGWMQD